MNEFLTPYFLDEAAWQPMETEAMSWLGTPYRHLGNFKGRGADCTLFIASVLKNIGLLSQLDYNYYPRDWHIHGQEEIVVQYYLAHEKYLPAGLEFEVTDGLREDHMRGDFVMMTLPPAKVIHHCGIMFGQNAMIHSINGAGVQLITFKDWWQRHARRTVRIVHSEKESQ